MNDVLKDERRILCDVLDQWEVRWSWTGDAEDQLDAGMRSRDETQPIMAGGCCEGCWGGPGPVMPANQRGAAHIWCGAVTLTHVRTRGEMWGMMTGPMILEMMLWQALSCFFLLKFLNCFMSNIYLYEDITCGVAGFLASANEMLQHPHTAGREIMTICGELTSSNDGRDVEIYCAEYSQGRGEAGNMYTGW